MDRDEVIWQHIQSAAAVMDTALVMLGKQHGAEALARASAAIRVGAMMQIVTTMSLAGTKALSINMIGPNGETLNMGRVEFDVDATLN